ncbi:ribosomal protein L11 methyltransferase PrmA [Peptoclostridium acidaminophilum DSM 3953]|uniref:Ribosomal protein L11 methyltransferase n=1 Tax=Peptoclostridium acidaminophilum DSM 3953 TaxID=1286171 RepID=W8T790_PEPAC|nr:50S ribosomal protein L11 methyltransferase [Peptoclostridium acidaminophilum]AHM56735.1 ribosomal protein L11 methyltransferase PrmA [Peptoclostridium acidaminophilum DSM 3953]
MKWTEITIKTTTEAVEAVTSILYEAEVGGIVIEDPNDFLFQEKEDKAWDYLDENNIFDSGYEGVVIKAYLAEEKNVVAELEMIREKIKRLPEYGLEIGEGSVEISEVDDSDWADSWKKYYKPTSVGERIVIKPSWEEYSRAEGELVIELDPGMAFGTGTHETTMMCITALEEYVTPEKTVFDIGCGSGILSIVAAKLGARKVIGGDFDEVAVKVARENVVLNGVEGAVDIRLGNLLEVVEDSADIVVANIIADVIVMLSKDVPKVIRPGGIFISSGIIHEKLDLVREALVANGFEIIKVEKLGEWAAVVAKKGE